MKFVALGKTAKCYHCNRELIIGNNYFRLNRNVWICSYNCIFEYDVTKLYLTLINSRSRRYGNPGKKQDEFRKIMNNWLKKHGCV